MIGKGKSDFNFFSFAIKPLHENPSSVAAFIMPFPEVPF